LTNNRNKRYVDRSKTGSISIINANAYIVKFQTNEFWGRELQFSLGPSGGDQSQRFELFLKSFLAQNPNLDEEIIRNPNNPQWRALTWLADEDLLALDPTSTDALQRSIALQRFILAAFYYSTEGIDWKTQHRFLEPVSVCEWKSHAGDNCLLQGVGCNAAGLVTKLRIGKFLTTQCRQTLVC
jgi:hypothetical protein